MAKAYQLDLTKGSILPKLIRFTMPIVFSSVLQLLFNAADIVVVGNYESDAAMTAVGSNAALINLMVNFFIGLSIGVNVLVANYVGGRKREDASKTVHTAMMLAVSSGLFLTVFGAVMAPVFLRWMNTPEKILPLATLYLRIYFLGMVPQMVYNFGAAILRAIGDTKRPLYFLTASGVLNLLLNLLFVIVFRWGVAGVALATIASMTLSGVLVLRSMLLERSEVRLELKKLAVSRDKLWLIFRMGFPAGLQSILFSLSNVIIQSAVNDFGDIVMGGNTAGANLEGFVYVAMNAFAQAAVSFVGQSVGAGEKKRIPRILAVSQVCVITMGVVTGNLMVLFGPKLLTLYTDNPTMIQYGLDRMRVVCRFYALCGIMDVMVGVLRGMGYSFMPMIVSLLGACGLRLLWIFTYFKTDAFHKPFWLYMTYPVSWIVTLSAHFICFLVVYRRMMRRNSRNG